MLTTTLGDSRSTRELWVDARCGVAGDMLLAALIDAGADLDAVRRAVAAVIGDAVAIETSEVRRAGQRATLVDVRLRHPDQPSRSWGAIRALLTAAGAPGPASAADLPPRVRAHAVATFATLAAAEARVHGIPVDEIHFHEVGAWDAIADVVGVCAALESLGVGFLVSTDVAVGDGAVRGAHGLLPVPAPAVAELLSAGPLGLSALPLGAEVGTEPVGELATPTGVALLAALADGGGGQRVPSMSSVAAVGVGAGHRETPGWANVVRVLLGPPCREAPDDARESDELGVEWLHVLEANVDDLDPRAWPGVLAALLGAGAVDAWLTPILMKKGRPAHTVAALVAMGESQAPVDAVRRALLRHTTTLGVRETTVRRTALPRVTLPVRVRLGASDGDVRVKVGHLGGRIVRATPEYEDCAALAAATDRPVAEVLAAASSAAHAEGLRPGEPIPTAGEDLRRG